MGFSKTIGQALSAKNMSPSELARKTGYSPQYIHELLKGVKRWNETSLQKVCEVLGLEMEIKERR